MSVLSSPSGSGPFNDECPDLTNLIIDDDAPLSISAQASHRLLVGTLYESWRPGRKFWAASNVGIFSSVTEAPMVPNVFVSFDVEPRPNLRTKENCAYFMWEFRKPPEVVVELAPEHDLGETGLRMERYARIGVSFYVNYDPLARGQLDAVQTYKLCDSNYVFQQSNILGQIGLQLIEWKGEFERWNRTWLRWATASGELILTGQENAERGAKIAEEERRRAEKERHRADHEQQRADQERTRADEERLRADALAEKLRQLGIDPTKP